MSAARFDAGESGICGLRAVRGAPLTSPQTANAKGPKPLPLTQSGFPGFDLKYGHGPVYSSIGSRAFL